MKPNYQVKNAVEHVGHLLTTLCRTQKGAFGSVAEGGNTVNELPHRVAPQKGFGDAENQKEEEVTCIPTLSEICLEQLCPEILCTNSKGCCPGDVRQAGDLPYHVASLKEEVALLEAAIQLCDEMPINTKLQVFGSNEIAGPTPNDANHGLQRALTREKTQSTLHKRERCWEEGTIVVEKREGASRSQAKRRHLSNQFIFGQNKTIQVTEQIACEQETSRSQSLSFPLQDEAMQTLQTIPSSLPFEEGKLENTIVIPDSQETFLPQSQSLMPHSEMQPKAIDRVQMQVPLHRPSTKRAMDGTRYRTQGFSVSQGKRSLKTPNNKAKDIRALLETHQAAQSAMRSKALYMVMDVDTLDDELAAVVSAFKRSNPLANFSSEVTE